MTSAHNTLLGHFIMDRYSCFDVRKDEGKRLVDVLQDLMKYEDDELRVCSTKLLLDIYKVSIYNICIELVSITGNVTTCL